MVADAQRPTPLASARPTVVTGLMPRGLWLLVLSLVMTQTARPVAATPPGTPQPTTTQPTTTQPAATKPQRKRPQRTGPPASQGRKPPVSTQKRSRTTRRRTPGTGKTLRATEAGTEARPIQTQPTKPTAPKKHPKKRRQGASDADRHRADPTAQGREDAQIIADLELLMMLEMLNDYEILDDE